MTTERTLTVQQCAELKLREAAETLNEIEASPDLMHMPEGLNGLSFVRDVATDEWLEEKRRNPELHVIPGGRK